MIRSSHQYHIAGKAIEFREKRVQDPLNLSGFLGILSLLAQCVELVKEQHTLMDSRVLKHFLQPFSRLSEIAIHDSFISDDEEGNTERRGDRFRQGGLSVSRRARQQDSTTRFEIVRAQDIGALLLFYKLTHDSLNVIGQHQIAE
jgi:hypothetical protein